MDAVRTDAVREIQLTQGYVALIDEADVSLIQSYSWHVLVDRRTCYAGTVIGGVLVRMHRFLLGVVDPNQFVDHRDRNGLNNTRRNLRLATRRQNRCNCDPIMGRQYQGVTFYRRDKRYVARITTASGKRLFLGGFETPEEAAMAYDAAAPVYHGEFARLNFPADHD